MREANFALLAKATLPLARNVQGMKGTHIFRQREMQDMNFLYNFTAYKLVAYPFSGLETLRLIMEKIDNKKMREKYV